MNSPHLPANEQQRLQRLRGLNLLDTGPEELLDGFTRLAAGITEQPMASITLIDADRQFIQSAVGMAQGGSTPRQHAFCARTICQPDLLEVTDARCDERFARNPFVTGEPHVVFYAGVPLIMSGGEAIGALCTYGPEPATLSASQRDLLREVAGMIVRLLERRQRVQQETHRQNVRLVNIIEHLPCGLAVFDRELGHVVSNRQARQLLDLPDSVFEEEPVTFRTMARFLARRGEYGPGDVEQLVDACVARVRTREQEHRESVRLNGTVLEVRGNYTPDGTVITTYTDITAAKDAEKALRDAMVAAERANDAKSAFLATMSHELRTPLNGVIGLTQVLAAAQLPVMEADAVGMIESCAKSLLSLIDNILDLSKIEAGRLTLEDVPTDLRALLQEVSDVFSVRASEKGIRFKLTLDGGVPRTVQCDPGRLKQILLNLLANALKFTQRGEFGLCVTVVPGSRDRFRFDIHDTGIGIAPADQRQLFTRYAQVDSSSTRRYQGTGLGLAISQQLAQLMGGRITVESSLGQGSTFRLDVPLKNTARLAPGQASAATAKSALRLLVAEDNEVNQMVARHLLAMLGHEDVTIVPNGADAVQACEEQVFDLILMDCQMPVMDGWEATRALRANGVRTPIAALTASATAEERQECLACGMDEFITKPVELSILGEKLARLLDIGLARKQSKETVPCC